MKRKVIYFILILLLLCATSCSIAEPSGGDTTVYIVSDNYTPSPHAETHENNGSDEVSVSGLSGLLADDQHIIDQEVFDAITGQTISPSIINAFVAGAIDMDKNSLSQVHSIYGRDNGHLYIRSVTTALQNTEYNIYLQAFSAPVDNWMGVLTIVANGTSPYSRLEKAMYLNGQSFNAGAGYAEIDSTGTEVIRLKSTQNSNIGVILSNYHIDTIGVVDDTPLSIKSYGVDEDGNTQHYGKFDIRIESPANGSETGKMSWFLGVGGGWNEAMTLSSNGTLCVDDSFGTFDEYDDAELLRKGISEGDKEVLVNAGVLVKVDIADEIFIGIREVEKYRLVNRLGMDGSVDTIREKYIEYEDVFKTIVVGQKYMIQLQPLMALLAGGVYQNRDKIDALELKVKELEERLAKLESK